MTSVVDSVISWAIITLIVYGSIIMIAAKAVVEKKTRRQEDMKFWADRR